MTCFALVYFLLLIIISNIFFPPFFFGALLSVLSYSLVRRQISEPHVGTGRTHILYIFLFRETDISTLFAFWLPSRELFAKNRCIPTLSLVVRNIYLQSNHMNTIYHLCLLHTHLKTQFQTLPVKIIYRFLFTFNMDCLARLCHLQI